MSQFVSPFTQFAQSLNRSFAHLFAEILYWVRFFSPHSKRTNMSISSISAWSPGSNPVTAIQGVTYTAASSPSPAIQTMSIPGTFVSNSQNRVAFSVSLNKGYRASGLSIGTDPNTINVTVVADSLAPASTFSDSVVTDVDFQTNNFTLSFQVAASGTTTKTYKFTKGGMGGGRPHL